MKKKSLFKNPFYRFDSLNILLFFTAWGIWWSFFQIWLTNTLHFSGEQVGTIYSFNSAITLILMFVYGAIQDRLRLKRHLLIFCSVMEMLLGPFFTWLYAPLLHSSFYLGTFLGSLYLSFAFLAASPTFEAVTERISRRYRFEYGQARSWGSFGYAVSALLAGFLFTISPNLVFWLSSFIALLLFLLLVFVHPEKNQKMIDLYENKIENAKESSTASPKEIVGVFKMKALWQIIIYIIFSTPLGDLRDYIGYSHTFLVISGITLIAGIYANFILKKDNVDVNGQPLSKD